MKVEDADVLVVEDDLVVRFIGVVDVLLGLVVVFRFLLFWISLHGICRWRRKLYNLLQ